MCVAIEANKVKDATAFIHLQSTSCSTESLASTLELHTNLTLAMGTAHPTEQLLRHCGSQPELPEPRRHPARHGTLSLILPGWEPEATAWFSFCSCLLEPDSLIHLGGKKT